MRKTPSYLKGLAETRARAAADVLCYQQLVAELQDKLSKAQNELTSCDTLIRKFDGRLDPNLITPINHWKGRYGKRGALRKAVIRLLQEQAPDELTTTAIGWAMQEEFRLVFVTVNERRDWLADSLRNCLKKLVNEGFVEPCHDRTNIGVVGRWRWKIVSCSGQPDRGTASQLR